MSTELWKVDESGVINLLSTSQKCETKVRDEGILQNSKKPKKLDKSGTSESKNTV